MVTSVTIHRYLREETTQAEDSVVREHRANVFINEKLYISLMCLPADFQELAVGFLYSEGIISSYADVLSVSSTCTGSVFVTLREGCAPPEEDRGKKRVLVSGCANGSVNLEFMDDTNLQASGGDVRLGAREVTSVMSEFARSSSLFQETGCVHSAALLLRGKQRLFYEDIGRHNAVDKIAGAALMQHIDLTSGIVLTSGRVSSEIIIKAAKIGVPMLISHSAPTDVAVEIAAKVNMTLIGFARGHKYNIYCGDFRITTP
jgi:FdhD protein